jgi:hypothetical protein
VPLVIAKVGRDLKSINDAEDGASGFKGSNRNSCCLNDRLKGVLFAVGVFDDQENGCG